MPAAKEQEGKLYFGGEEKTLSSGAEYFPSSEVESKNCQRDNYLRHCFQTTG